MFGDGNSTGDMRDWVMFTRGGTSRFRWNWLERVNRDDEVQEELESLRRSVQRGRPFGPPEWQKEIAKRLGPESAYWPTGRPRKFGRNQDAAPR
jgi:hypothetical protein